MYANCFCFKGSFLWEGEEWRRFCKGGKAAPHTHKLRIKNGIEENQQGVLATFSGFGVGRRSGNGGIRLDSLISSSGAEGFGRRSSIIMQCRPAG